MQPKRATQWQSSISWMGGGVTIQKVGTQIYYLAKKILEN